VVKKHQAWKILMSKTMRFIPFIPYKNKDLLALFGGFGKFIVNTILLAIR
jgi:hypothetical protein